MPTLCFEPGTIIGKEDEFQVSGESELQRRGPMTEKSLLPSDDRTYEFPDLDNDKIYFKIHSVACLARYNEGNWKCVRPVFSRSIKKVWY